MKIAILTYYEIANYGTLLQAYGLWKFLEARGHQVEFLDEHYGRSTSMDNRTIVMREYPSAWKLGDEPYYPINNPESAALLKRYQDEAAKIPNLIVDGRLGGYKYYDMDQAMAAALELQING